MPKFDVEVSKDYHQMGTISVEAKTKAEAIDKVDKMMADNKKPLQTCDPRIDWDGIEYVDFSFTTTGNVEKTE
jgi:hypothetical protein